MEFNQEAWLKYYIDMKSKLRTKAKTDFEKDFLKLMNNLIFWMTIENVRKQWDTIVSDTNYHVTKWF